MVRELGGFDYPFVPVVSAKQGGCQKRKVQSTLPVYENALSFDCVGCVVVFVFQCGDSFNVG